MWQNTIEWTWSSIHITKTDLNPKHSILACTVYWRFRRNGWLKIVTVGVICTGVWICINSTVYLPIKLYRLVHWQCIHKEFSEKREKKTIVMIGSMHYCHTKNTFLFFPCSFLFPQFNLFGFYLLFTIFLSMKYE